MTATTTTATITYEEFLRDYGDTDGYELDQGRIVRIAMPYGEHGEICANTISILRDYIKPRNLGRLCSNDSFVRVKTDPPSVRGADVLFVSYESLPKDQPTPRDRPFEKAPELVVEVRSPSDRMTKVMNKANEYIDAGVCVVIVIDPETRSLAIVHGDEFPRHYHNGDIVEIPELFPDFKVPLAKFFE